MCKIKNFLLLLTALFFITNNATANQPDPAQLDAQLISKVSFGRNADVELLLRQGAKSNAVNPAGIPAIILASGRSDEEGPKIVNSLINAGADIHNPDINGNFPIIEAVKRGHPLTVKLLIQSSSLMAVKDMNGRTLPELASMRNQPEIISFVEQGIEAENKKLGQLKGSGNLTKLVQQQAFLNCTNYYLRYFKRDNPDKIGEEKFADLIKKNEAETADVKSQLSALFDLKPSDFSYITTETSRQIKDKLDSLLTNDNRLYNGFGTNTDMNGKCRSIATKWDGSRFTYVDRGGRKAITGYK